MSVGSIVNFSSSLFFFFDRFLEVTDDMMEKDKGCVHFLRVSLDTKLRFKFSHPDQPCLSEDS
jgi:hypothetical protein